MSRYISIIILTLLGCGISSAQKSMNLRPRWVGNTPKNSNSEYYFIEVHSDASSTLPGARASVKQEIASNVERTDKVSVKEIFDDKSTQNYDGNNASMNSTDSYQLQLTVEGTARQIKSRRIDEYWETVQRGGLTLLDYYALYAVERSGANADFSGITATSSYGVHGLWRSAIVPGWGQLYKGSTAKGACIMGGTALCVGAIVYTDCMRRSYTTKIANSHNAAQKKAYADKRTAFTTGRNICIGALCALYVYNIVDAIVAPGARRIITSPAGSNNFSYFWSPAVTDNNGIGVVASITF